MYNQPYFQVNEIVTGKYYGKSFIGTIYKRDCINNGKNPAWAYYIKLESPIESWSGPVDSICWIDRDQLSMDSDNQLMIVSK